MASASFINTLVAGNTVENNGPDVYGSVTSLGFNLIGNTQGSSGWGGADRTNANARLAPLGYYGGPTQTIALLSNSPAIGWGIKTDLTSDQRGFPLNHPVDIGAFQSQSGSLAFQVNTTADGSSVPSGKLGLRGAIGLANVLSGANTITFAPSVFGTAQTITLTSGQLVLSNALSVETIVSPAAGLTVSGGGLNRVFQINQGVTASISGLTITGGGGAAVRGGGMLILGTANLTLTNCIVTGNTGSTNGGGLANYGSLTLTNCTISANSAAQNGGGLFTGSKATLTNCTIAGNMANGQGAGLSMSGAALSLTGCTISDNTATQSGGGLSLSSAPDGAVNLTNCTITGNTADGGGGLYNRSAMTLLSCTVTANFGGAKGGGGLFNVSTRATLTNTIVAGNTNASETPSDIQGGVSVAGTFNLIGPGGSGGIPTGPGTGNIVLTDLTGLGLAPLDYYGGPTQTMAVLPGSKAIGAGTLTPGLSSDQRGFPLDTPKPDIGAFQVQSTPLVVDTNLDGPRCRTASSTCAGRSTWPMCSPALTPSRSSRPCQARRSF